jgi:peptide subunit release factor 1 (eRF1)
VDKTRTEYMTNIINGAKALQEACQRLRLEEETASNTKQTRDPMHVRAELEKSIATVKERHDHLETTYKLWTLDAPELNI